MKSKLYNSDNLTEIRQKIDVLDQRLHDTFIERAELVLQVGEEKKKNNIEVIQPAREASMIRRLVSKGAKVLPDMTIVRIWRELLGATSRMQTHVSVTVAQSDEYPEYWDLAKDYFGGSVPMSRSVSSLVAVSTVREGKETFAVVPYPNGGVDDADAKLWWEMLDPNADPNISIVVSLPHGVDPKQHTPDFRAVVIGNAGFYESGDDNSFIYIKCGASMSRDKIVSLAEEAGLGPISLSSKYYSDGEVIRKHLLEARGYFTNSSEQIKRLQEFCGAGVLVSAVGGYPVPCQYSKVSVDAVCSIPNAPIEK